MALRNRLKYWRHKLQIDKKKEFAELLGVTPQQISLWENHDKEPKLESIYNAWKKLKELVPELNMQDLLEDDDSSQ